MRSISSTVRDIVTHSPLAVEALQKEILNVSAYARTIRQEVERRTMKRVSVASISVAVSRLQEEVRELPRIEPQVVVDEIVIKPNLVEIIFIRNDATHAALQRFYNTYKDSSHFVAFTYGLKEISVVISQALKEELGTALHPTTPLCRYSDLTSIGLATKENYMDTPNVFHSLLKKLAPYGINVVEIMTTLTEISLIIETKDLDDVLNIFNNLVSQSPPSTSIN